MQFLHYYNQEGDLMSIFNETVIIKISNSKKVDSGLEGKLPERKLRGWAKYAAITIATIGIGLGANHYTGDPTGLEKKLGLNSPVVKTMVFDSKEYRVIKVEGYNYSFDDMIKVNEYIRKLKPQERSSVGTVYVSRYEGKLIVPVLIRRGVADTNYTDPVEILVGELKEGDEYITGRESGSSKTATTQANPFNILGMPRR